MSDAGQRDLLERRLADWVFYLLLAAAVILAGWLGARHDRVWDLSLGGRNSLSAESAAVLAGLAEPVSITVFMDRAQAKRVEALLLRYRRALPNLAVRYLDPQLFPEEARAAGVSLVGQMQVEYAGRHETLSRISEEELTAALVRLSRADAPWIAVLEGHGERRADGTGATDLGRFGELLRGRGYRLQPLDLATTATVPDNTALLILSTPAIPVFPGEVEALIAFLERGGNLLWLMDPGDLGGLEPLAEHLGIERLPGLLVDANVAELNIDDPTVALVSRYPDHPLVRGLSAAALFPGSLAFAARAAPGWGHTEPLATLPGSWNETGPVRGEVRRDPDQGEAEGPLPLALALTRQAPSGEGEQRLLVLGDGDFLSNAHLETAGNRALGLAMVHWLTSPVALPSASAGPAERELALTRGQILVLGGGSLVVLPLVFLTVGLLVHRRRRRG
ncbi:MAG: GldG family protein [Chromatiaceae bacterium]|jgi:hypothetical protein|nr:GldG family protein [Chromatiaceae bacterium]